MHDGAVLPILHLNGYKIAGPTVLARIPREELEQLLRGYGYAPHFVEGDEPAEMHQQMAATLDEVVAEIRAHPGRRARRTGSRSGPRWPMIVLRTPKGWTGPKIVDGVPIEGTFRAAPGARSPSSATNPEHLALLEAWMKSYRPEELFDGDGRLVAASSPRCRREGDRRMGANPHANGGLLRRTCACRTSATYAVDVPAPGRSRRRGHARAGRVPPRRAARSTREQRNFRDLQPRRDGLEPLGRRLRGDQPHLGRRDPADDDHVSPDGRVMEMLSEHQCQGWLEGYLLTGRHGFFSCYEAFIHIVDSMFNQHAKWLKVTRTIPWRRPIASLNYLLTSHVWRQDHNGFSHQDPGLHRPRRQQEGRRHPRLPAAGREHAPLA